MQIDDVRTVLVVGLGVMGQQIGLLCAYAGYDVILYDADPQQAQRLRGRNEELLELLVRDRCITREMAPRMLDRLSLATISAEAACAADVLIESISENRRAKVELFAEFDRLCPPHTVF